MNIRRATKGFTLLEVMVSMAILALMVLMLSRVFNVGSSSIRRGSDDALLDEAARFVLDNLQTDISQALVRTNVPFRVDTVSSVDALYFVSTAIRRQLETNPRDTGPVQLRGVKRMKMVSALNRRVVFEYATGTTANSNKARQQLIKQSNFYRTGKVKLGGDMDYTEPLISSERLTNQAVLTFLDFRINGDSNSSSSARPRFVDVIIGLTAANDMRHAMRLHDSQGESRAEAYLSNHERVYSRRIYFPNIGTTRLTF